MDDIEKLEEIKNNLKVQINTIDENISFSAKNSSNTESSNKVKFSNKNINKQVGNEISNIDDQSNLIKIGTKESIKISRLEENENPDYTLPKANLSNFNYGNTLYDNKSEFTLNPADISYEGYVYKTRKGNKLRKYYLGIIGTDLVYFSNSKKTKLKGMHNLTGTYIFEEDKINKVKRENDGKGEDELDLNDIYYQFTLIFNKKKRSYFCLKEDDVKNWIKFIKKAINLRNVKDFYEFKNKLGEGKFGLVKGGIDKKTGEKVAIKIIDKSKLEGIEQEMVMTEYEIMAFCRHSNIVKCFDQFEDYENIYIVLEYLSGGTLVNFLSFQDTILSEKKIKEIILQIGKGINYIHHFGILHRDLKPENLMMSSKNYETSKLKIVDFGLSKILGIEEKADEAYGTLSFAAPEVVQNRSYNNTIDIWSIGIIIYFLVTGQLPFSSKNKSFDLIANSILNSDVNYDPIYWNRFSPLSKDLTKKCLEKYPNKRLKIKDFIEHEWFKD